MFELDRRLLGNMRNATLNFVPLRKEPVRSLACGGCQGTCKGMCKGGCKGMCTGCRNSCKGKCKGTKKGK